MCSFIISFLQDNNNEKDFWNSFLKDLENANDYEQKYNHDHMDTDSFSTYSNSLSPQSASSGGENVEPSLLMDSMDTSNYTTNVSKEPSIFSYESIAPVDTFSTNIDIGMIYACI